MTTIILFGLSWLYCFATIRWGFPGIDYVRRCGYMEDEHDYGFLGALFGGVGFFCLWWIVVPVVWLLERES